MNFLLDTHAFLWFVNDHFSFSATAKDIIEEQQSLVYLSAASIWEMAIKSSLEKLALPASLQQFVETHIAKNEFGVLQITAEQAEEVAKLPFPKSGHRDPFDRMIIAQAICHDLTIITRDDAFREYPVRRLW
ncbi:MAG: type II toxin-antitoxin system VapC family toxin [Chloroflexota bacterium]|nr:type II toxin-antitoxin system VapC family toxin [Chloroflexota bacterium]MDE2910730.1 type II toxin-antitoxin system VapC family toxin [Chloroflexota bacterium]